jgi:2,5-diketo-D-gluconate reductase B
MDSLLTQGIALPRLGLGTWRLSGAACQAAVESALALGYRHIDTAEMYGNEQPVGDAIAAAVRGGPGGSLDRDQLHVTTKVWHENLAPDAIRRAFDASLARLRLDYVDLYLIHWPSPRMDLAAALKVLMELRQEGRTRAIGVCNFNLPLLRRAVEEIGAPIACNQIEYHVFLGQMPMRAYLAQQRIPLVAYAPLAQGRLAESPELAAIAQKHGATPAQVALAWLLGQEGVCAIPKAGRRESQQANLDALKIKLDDDDRARIEALPKDRRFVNPAFAPDWNAR